MKTAPLQPFGLEVTLPAGFTWDDLNLPLLKAWVDEHHVVLLRGLAPQPPEQLARDARGMGRLQPWRFGSVHELKLDPDADNYLYTDHEVPLHWDGAFAEEVPHWLLFRCVRAPLPGAGGETLFVETGRVLDHATPEQQDRWSRSSVRYRTEKKAHYGGTFVADVVDAHPTLGNPVLRYAEPVDDLNPVEAEPSGPGAEGLHAELHEALYAPEALLAHAWRDGDVLLQRGPLPARRHGRAGDHRRPHGRRGGQPARGSGGRA